MPLCSFVYPDFFTHRGLGEADIEGVFKLVCYPLYFYYFSPILNFEKNSDIHKFEENSKMVIYTYLGSTIVDILHWFLCMYISINILIFICFPALSWMLLNRKNKFLNGFLKPHLFWKSHPTVSAAGYWVTRASNVLTTSHSGRVWELPQSSICFVPSSLVFMYLPSLI